MMTSSCFKKGLKMMVLKLKFLKDDTKKPLK